MSELPDADEIPNDGEDEAPIRRALKISVIGFAVVALVAAGTVLWINRPAPKSDPLIDLETTGPKQIPAESVAPPALPFTDITAAAGIDFVHVNGAFGERLLPETMGGGVAFLDYDNDGLQDLLLINSGYWPGRPPSGEMPTSRLYRNLGDGRFEDVTAATGLDLALYGMGVAAGDYDGDGYVDIFVTAVGENRLLRNIDGQRFVDMTAEMRVAGTADAWSTSAAFFDYDGDGDLDLFACNYVVWSPEINAAVDYRLTGIGRAYGPPTDFAGTDGFLYRNDGDRFTDVSATAGIRIAHETSGLPVGKGLAAHPVDVDGDGWLDLAVANDTVRNFLFLNNGDGSFREAAVDAGFAFDSGGLATGAMGIDSAYFANDDQLAIVIGNFANEMSSFYVSRSGRVFSDDAIVTGVGADSRRALTFGLAFIDVDLDGYLDLLAANGHVEPEINRVQSSQRYRQPLQLHWNCGARCARRFRLAKSVGDLATPRAGRGMAYADIDNDGDLDLAITEVGGRAVLLRNDQALGHHWLRLRLVAESPNVHAVGARVTLAAAGMTHTRTVMPARSYLSQVELPVTFGLGETTQIESVTVRWPSGESETWPALAVDREHNLIRGTSPQTAD